MKGINSLIIAIVICFTTSAAQEPPARMYHTMNCIGEKVYLFGGENEDTWLNDLWEMSADPGSENVTWKLMQPTGDLPSPTYQHSAVVYNDELYLINGRTTTSSNFPLLPLKIYKYSPSTNIWKLLNYDEDSSPREMYAHSSQVIGDKLYISCKNEMWEFSFTSNTWRQMSDSPYYEPAKWNFQWHSTAVYNNKFYVLRGGIKSDGNVYVFDPIANSWSVIAPKADSIIPDNVWGAASWFDGKYFYSFDGRVAISGNNKSGSPNEISSANIENSVLAYAFNFIAGEWLMMRLKQAIDNMYSSAAVPLSGFTRTVYRTGGRDETGTVRKYGEKIEYEIEEEDPKDVVLWTDVEPIEALQDGCTVSDGGTFPINSMVPLSFTTVDGWRPSHWSGDISGPLLPAQILMDDDHDVTANFKPLLVLGFSSQPARNIAPPKPDDEVVIGTTNISVYGVDWMLNTLEFTPLKKVKAEYAKIFLKYKGTIKQGSFATDGLGFITKISFTIGQLIAEGETLALQVYYQFEFPPNEKGLLAPLNEVKRLGIAINRNQVGCVPIINVGGIKEPQETFSSHLQTIASIWNVSVAPNLPFLTIQEAIDHPATSDSDKIEVWEGYYKSDKTINITKELNFYGIGSREKIIVETSAKSGLTIDKPKILMDGFTFQSKGTSCEKLIGYSYQDKNCNFIFRNNTFYAKSNLSCLMIDDFNGESIVENNKFYGDGGEESYGVKFRQHGSTFIERNLFSNLSVGIYLSSGIGNTEPVNSVNITGNTAENCTKITELYHKIDVTINENDFQSTNGNNKIFISRSEGVKIYNQKLENNIFIQASRIDNSEIYENESLTPGGILIVEIDSSQNTKIYNNKDLYLLTQANAQRYNILEIYNNEALHMYLQYCHKTNVINNIIEDGPQKGIELEGCMYTNITNNQILNSTLDGISVSDGYKNIFRHNVIKGNKLNGMMFRKGGNMIIKNNIITENGHDGIDIVFGEWPEISRNVISKNTLYGIEISCSDGYKLFYNSFLSNTAGGILATASHMDYSSLSKILYNTIVGSKHGIFLAGTRNLKIMGNTLLKNCTGIITKKIKSTKIYKNKIYDSWCMFTGIHLDNSDVEIENNSFSNNNGATIGMFNNSKAIVNGNNFLNTPDLAIYNDNQVTMVNVDQNYWGNINGPAENYFEGNINYDTWLSRPTSLILGIEQDTIAVSSGTIDSTLIVIGNFILSDDRVLLKIEDEKGWLSNGGEHQIVISDSQFTYFPLEFRVPENAGSLFNNKVKISAVSLIDSQMTSIDSFYILNYSQELTRFKILPDSVTFATNDTLQLFSIAYDQFNNELAGEYNFRWSVSEGVIDSSGLFITPEYESVVSVTVTEAISGFSASTEYSILNDPLSPHSIIISPDSIAVNPNSQVYFVAESFDKNGFRIHSNVVWSTNAGTIDSLGLLECSDLPGSYFVKATSVAGNVFGETTITIKTPTNIKDDNATIPTEFSLLPNYPNPFNPSTVISFQLPVVCRVKLKIFNILGQKITVLKNGEILSAGIYQQNWDATHLSGGVYFLVIHAVSVNDNREFSSVKKMMLLK